MIKIGCTLLNLVKMYLHKSTNYKFYPFCVNDKDLCENIGEDMTGGPSIVFTDMQKFKARHNQTRNFDNMVMSFYQESRPERKTESFFPSGKHLKIGCFNVDGYYDHCKTVFEAMGYYYDFCSCQEARSSLTYQDIERGNKKREMDDMRREYIKEKGYKVEEMWECDWWESFKTNDNIKNLVRTYFPYKRPVFADSLLAKIKDGCLFDYAQCDFVVPDELKSKIAIFPSTFKNTEVGRNDSGDYMKNYAIENEMLKHPQSLNLTCFLQLKLQFLHLHKKKEIWFKHFFF